MIASFDDGDHPANPAGTTETAWSQATQSVGPEGARVMVVSQRAMASTAGRCQTTEVGDRAVQEAGLVDHTPVTPVL